MEMKNWKKRRNTKRKKLWKWERKSRKEIEKKKKMRKINLNEK